MKPIRTLLFVAALSALSCGKLSTSEEAELIRVSVGVSGVVQTKVTGIVSNGDDSEGRVNTLQVFVFNGNDRDGYALVDGASAVDVVCSAGYREVWAVVNGEDLSGVTTKRALLSCVATLPDRHDRFVMVGHTALTLEPDSGISVPVSRLAARVVLRGIRNVFKNSAQADAFHLDAVYLVNVSGDIDYGRSVDYAVTRWYNRKGYEPENSISGITYDVIDADVAYDATYGAVHSLYAMPNPHAPLIGGVWTPRRSLLVVRATIAGAAMSYPIVLPVLESNKSYEISLLSISRPGNPDSDNDGQERPIMGIEEGFQVSVTDWSTVLVCGDGEADGNVTI